MAIDHEAHKIRIKAVSDRMSHPMTYNDAGAPRVNMEGRKFPSQVVASDQYDNRVPGRRK